jgi:hypothetical protein
MYGRRAQAPINVLTLFPDNCQLPRHAFPGVGFASAYLEHTMQIRKHINETLKCKRATTTLLHSHLHVDFEIMQQPWADRACLS